MKFSDIINEDAKADRAHVADARRAWDSLLQQVKVYLSKKGLTEFDYFEKTYDDLFGPLTLATFHVNHKDTDYRVTFERREGTVKGRMRTFKNRDTDDLEKLDIVLYQTFENDIDLISYKDFEGQLRDTFRNTFIHEYTHLTDVVRAVDPKRYTATKQAQTQAGEYINTPHEFNAFYAQVVDDAERVFASREPLNIFKRTPDFKTFLGLLRTDSEAARVLDSESSGKFRKAFIRRAYQLYQEYKQEIEQE